MKIQSVIIAIFTFVFCYQCSNRHINRRNTEKIQNVEKMIKDKSFTQGTLDENYVQHSIKVKGSEGDGLAYSYDFTFAYIVNKETFYGKTSYSNLPAIRMIKVYYLNEKPEVYSLNPTSDLQVALKDADSYINLYFAIGWGFVFIIAVLGNYKEYKESKDESDRKELARKKRIADFKRNMQ